MAKRRTSVIQVMITGDASDLNKATRQGSDGMGLLGAAAITAAKVVTSALSGIAAFSIREFARFDNAMTQSQAIMGDLSDTTKKAMSDVAREVGVTTTFAAHEAAEAFYFLASAGLDAEQSMAVMPRVAAFAQAGMFDLARATDILTDAQSALGLSSDDAAENLANMTELSNVMVGAATLANASVEQFGEAFMRAGARIRMVGVPLEEASAVLGAFADQGVKGAAGGEALNIILRDLPRAADRNAKAFRDLGIRVEDADGKFRPMADIIQDFEGALDGLSATQQANVFTTLGLTRSVADQLSVLVGTSEQIRQYEADLKLMGDVTQEVADKQLTSFSNQIALTRAQFTNIALTIGKALEGPLRAFNLWLREQTPAIEAFVNNAIPAIGRFVDDAKNKFDEFRLAFNRNVVDPLVAFGAQPVVIAFFAEFEAEFDRFIERIKNLGIDLKRAIDAENPEAIGRVLGTFVAEVFRTAFGRGEIIGDLIKEAFGAQDFFELGAAVGAVATDFLKGFVTGLLAVPRNAEGEVDKEARTIAKMLTENFTGTFIGALILSRVPIIGAPIRLLLRPALTGFRVLAGAMVTGIGRIFARLLGGMVSGTVFAGIFSNVGLTIQRLFAGQFASIPAKLMAVISGMFSGLGGFLFKGAKMLPTLIRQGLVVGFPTLVAFLKTGGLLTLLKGFGALVGGLVAAVGGWPIVLLAAAVAAFLVFIRRFTRWSDDQEEEYEGVGKRFVAFIVQGVQKFPFFERIRDWFLDRIEDIKNIAKSLNGEFEGVGKSIIQGIISGANLMSGGLTGAITNIVRDAWNGAKNWLQMRSPSKKFAELGDAMGEGMSKGLMDTHNLLAAAGVSASRQAFQGAEGALRAPEVPLVGRVDDQGQTIINVTVTSADPQAVVEAIKQYTRLNGPLSATVKV